MALPLTKILIFQKNMCFKSFPFSCGRSNHRCLGRRCSQKKIHTSSYLLKTMEEVKKKLDFWMGEEMEKGFSLVPRDRSHLLKLLVDNQTDLPHRAMKDSFSTAVIPLSSQPRLQHRYATVTGKLRMGRIMEDMDFFAVYIALKHIKNPKWEEGAPTPYTIVTAAVDDIEFCYDKPSVNMDVRLSGKVVNAGKTSMDVYVALERKLNGDWRKMTVANFTMVARNSTLTGPAIVNKLVPDGPEEEKELKESIARKQKKIDASKSSLLNTPPSLEEQKLIHDIFMKSLDLNDIGLNRRVIPEGSMWMEESTVSSCFFPHPENKNHHNTVFGGYIIRLALELAWMTAYKYSSQKPSLRYITNITFKNPVNISQYMQIKSQVIYTSGKYMQICIYIEMLDIMTRLVQTTHSLYVTYEVSKPVKIVMPKTYHEAMLWLEGYREFKQTTLYNQL